MFLFYLFYFFMFSNSSIDFSIPFITFLDHFLYVLIFLFLCVFIHIMSKFTSFSFSNQYYAFFSSSISIVSFHFYCIRFHNPSFLLGLSFFLYMANKKSMKIFYIKIGDLMGFTTYYIILN